jgi:peptidoglycan/xylan/chitin deacetylase (PgdA/CDA1 family)
MAKSAFVSLMYHELQLSGRGLCNSEPGYTRYVLPEQDFRSQVEYLKAKGYHGLSMGQALAFPDGSKIAITFDDGSETDLLAAAPILREAGFGATFYVTTGWVGSPGYMSPTQLKELSGHGFEIGCHSKTHAFLTDLDDTGLKREIADAKSDLEQILGKPVEHFSCPGGRHNQRAVAIARAAGYKTIATSFIHANSADTDVFALGRVAILRGMTERNFADICSGSALPRMRTRSAIRDAVKGLLGNSFYNRVRKILLGGRNED